MSHRRGWHPLTHADRLLCRRSGAGLHRHHQHRRDRATDLPSTDRKMHMVFGRRGFFGYAVRPNGETYWFSNYAQNSEPPLFDSAIDADRYRQRLLTLHRDDPPEVRTILQAASGTMGAYPVYDILSLPAWHRGAVCLIGDAAHAIGPHVGPGCVTRARRRVRGGEVLAGLRRVRRPRSQRSSGSGGAAWSRSSRRRAGRAVRKLPQDGSAGRSAIWCCRCSSDREPGPRARSIATGSIGTGQLSIADCGRRSAADDWRWRIGERVR